MADITMCENHKCYVKEKCYRYQAIPSEYQSYSYFDYDDSQGNCFWEFKNDTINKQSDKRTR